MQALRQSVRVPEVRPYGNARTVGKLEGRSGLVGERMDFPSSSNVSQEFESVDFFEPAAATEF
jgi:hypothetical protein